MKSLNAVPRICGTVLFCASVIIICYDTLVMATGRPTFIGFLVWLYGSGKGFSLYATLPCLGMALRVLGTRSTTN